MRQIRKTTPWLVVTVNCALILWTLTVDWTRPALIPILLTNLSVLSALFGLPMITLLIIARYRRSGGLTPSMLWAQAVMWLALFAFGATAVKSSDDSPQDRAHSLWTDLVGWTPDAVAASDSASRSALAVALTAWLALFVLLVLDLRRHLVTNWIPEERRVPSGPASRRRDLSGRNLARKR